jgi:hypothetical protein
MTARLWPLLLYAGLALLFTYPLALHFGGALVGQGDDVLQGYWNMWWARQAVEQGHNPFQTPLMHHPFGLSLYFHTHNLLNSLLTLPIQVCCGIPAAFNLAALLALTLAGLGAYALTYYLTRTRPAALLAGLVYAFSPYMVLPLSFGHLHLLSTHWLPFYLLALLYGLRERREVLALAALLLFLIGLTDWHYTLYGILLTLLVGIAEALRQQNWRARAALACQGVRYVGIYKNEDFWLDDPASLPRLERALFAGRAPLYEDAAMRVYALDTGQHAAPYWTLAPRQWYDVQANEQGVYYRWARGEQGALLLYPCGQQQATVELTLFGFAVPRTIQATWNGQPVGEVALPPGTLRRVRLLLPLEAGENRLQFRSLEPATPPTAEGFADDARLLSFNVSQVEVRGNR